MQKKLEPQPWGFFGFRPNPSCFAVYASPFTTSSYSNLVLAQTAPVILAWRDFLILTI